MAYDAVVEIAFDSAPNAEEETIVWTDVTADVRSIVVSRGHNQELELFQPGTATVVLSNADRRYDPMNLAGPYVVDGETQVLPMKRLRIRAQDVDSLPIYEGYIDGWHQVYNGPHDALAEVTVTDAFKVLAKSKLPSGPFMIDAAAAGPAHWWPLNEPSGSLGAYDEITGDLALADNALTAFFGEEGLLSFSSDTSYYQDGQTDNFLNCGSAGLLPQSAVQHMHFSTTNVQGVWTPKHASYSGLANIDIRARISDSWVSGLSRAIVGQAGFAPGDFYSSWVLYINGTGQLRIALTKADGSAVTVSGLDQLGATYADNAIVNVAATVEHTTGNSFNVRLWHTDDTGVPSDVTTWTQDSVGTVVVDLGAPTLHNPTSSTDLCVGNAGYVNEVPLLASYAAVSDIYSVTIRSSVNGTVVASPDFTDTAQWAVGDSGGTTGTDSTGKVWTVVNSGTVQPIVLGAVQPFSVSAVVQFDEQEEVTTNRVICQQGTDSGTTNFWKLYVNATGHAVFEIEAGASNGIVTSNVVVAEGEIHHVVAIYGATGVMKIYVDGIDATAVADTQLATMTDAAFRIGNAKPESAATAWAGWISHVQTFTRTLAASEIEALYNATVQPWAGDTTGERINKIADAVALPATRRSLDLGDSVLQAGGFGSDALSLMQLVAQSELIGSLFIAKDGDLRFISRGNQFDREVAATFSDVYGEGSPFQAMEPEYGDWLLRNDVTIQRDQGKSQNVKDPASIAAYLSQGYELAGLQHDSDELSLAVAESLVEQYSQPKLRISSLTVQPLKDPDTLLPLVLGLELGDWINVEWTPQGVGDPGELTCVIEKITHQISDGGLLWVTTFNLSPAPVGIEPVPVISGDAPAPTGFPVNLNSLDNRVQHLEADVVDLQGQIDDDVASLTALISALQTATADSGWISMGTLSNGWAYYGAPFSVPAYRKVGKQVFLRGLVRFGTPGTTIFTLPAGYRPAYQVLLTGVDALNFGASSGFTAGTNLSPHTTSGTTGGGVAAHSHTVPSHQHNTTSLTITMPNTGIRVDVTTGGAILHTASGSNDYICLDGLSFFVD